MRTKAFALASILPIALACIPSAASAQRVVYGDCRGRFESRYHDCWFNDDVARANRQEAARMRADGRETARMARDEARARAAEARARARIRQQTAIRFRADELRYRLRDRTEWRQYERRGRYYREW